MSSFQKQLKRAKRQFMIVSSTWTSNKKKIHSLENLCKRSGGKTFLRMVFFETETSNEEKKGPYCVSTCVCFCNTAHSLNKGPRMCAIRAPAFAPNSPINCATVCLRFGGFLSIIGRGFIGFKAGSRGDRGSRVRISWERETLFSQGVESRKIFSLGLSWPN